MLNKNQSTTNKKTGLALKEDVLPRSTDVCCGRGKIFAKHPGNRIFQKIIQANLERYHDQAFTKKAKNEVVSDVVLALRNKGIRFLKPNFECSHDGDQKSSICHWTFLTKSSIHRKVSHAIRDQRRTHGSINATIISNRQLSVPNAAERHIIYPCCSNSCDDNIIPSTQNQPSLKADALVQSLEAIGHSQQLLQIHTMDNDYTPACVHETQPEASPLLFQPPEDVSSLISHSSSVLALEDDEFLWNEKEEVECHLHKSNHNSCLHISETSSDIQASDVLAPIHSPMPLSKFFHPTSIALERGMDNDLLNDDDESGIFTLEDLSSNSTSVYCQH